MVKPEYPLFEISIRNSWACSCMCSIQDASFYGRLVRIRMKW
jgi:hypothetical protein